MRRIFLLKVALLYYGRVTNLGVRVATLQVAVLLRKTPPRKANCSLELAAGITTFYKVVDVRLEGSITNPGFELQPFRLLFAAQNSAAHAGRSLELAAGLEPATF